METFDPVVKSALLVLRGKKARRPSFSLKEVRDIINEELGLDLTEEEDGQIKASLSAQNDVRKADLEGKRWKFGSGQPPKSLEIRR